MSHDEINTAERRVTRPLPPEWECIASPASDYGGHALEPVHAVGNPAWPAWRCIHCVDVVSIAVEVDALALMMDGTPTLLGRAGQRQVENRSHHGGSCILQRKAERSPDVAEAILELEGYADIWPGDEWLPGGPPLAALANAVLHAVRNRSIETGQLIWGRPQLLEAAALLRDGWRPGGES